VLVLGVESRREVAMLSCKPSQAFKGTQSRRRRARWIGEWSLVSLPCQKRGGLVVVWWSWWSGACRSAEVARARVSNLFGGGW
jgi:hypothetical protein